MYILTQKVYKYKYTHKNLTFVSCIETYVNSFFRTKEPNKKEPISKNQSSSEKRQQLNLLMPLYMYIYQII